MPKGGKARRQIPKWNKRHDFLARMLVRASDYIKVMDPVFNTELPMRAIEMDFAYYLETGAQRQGGQRQVAQCQEGATSAGTKPTKRSQRSAAT
jgi:hypothetical protein